MGGPKIFNQTMWAIGRSLNFRATRHNLITSNLANAETPGYKAKDIEFESMLQRALSDKNTIPLAKTNPKHLQGAAEEGLLSSEPEIIEREKPAGSFDGNSVQVDKEMGRLSENTLLYQAEVDILSRMFAGLKFSIDEGGR